jgi:hypothetical protein
VGARLPHAGDLVAAQVVEMQAGKVCNEHVCVCGGGGGAAFISVGGGCGG